MIHYIIKYDNRYYMIFNQYYREGSSYGYSYYFCISELQTTNKIDCDSVEIKLLSIEEQLSAYYKYFTKFANMPKHLIESNLIEKL